MSRAQDYPLGYSELEARRLAEQAALLEGLTAEVFRRAGLRGGMRVLDIGCGVGDVSLLAARLVGPKGAVLGIDRAASSVQAANGRATALGINHVRFEQADLDSFEADQTFDALVGRLVLLYLADPADWLLAAFTAAGAQLDMGAKLYSSFLRAGFPPPDMTAATLIASGPATTGYGYMVGVLRSLLPLIERTGIATASEIDIDTLAARMHDDALAHERVMFLPRVVGAWTALPGTQQA
jgi:SAM-dependent methyltransferase